MVIPVFNAEGFLRRSLGSVLSQTYRDLEIIVVDDGSTDRTAEMVRSHPDPRLRYIYQVNAGQGAARNEGIRRSTGGYLSFLDADDMYLPDKLSRQVAFLEAHPEFAVCYGRAVHFYSATPTRLFARGRDYPSGDILPDLLHSSLINLNTAVFRREIFEQGLGFQEGVQGRYGEEWELYLRLARAGCKFGFLDEAVAVVEIREGSNTTWEAQWLIKKHTVEMFEGLASGMSSDERTQWRMDKVLRSHRLKLAIAYLVDGRSVEALRVLEEAAGRPWSRIAAGFIVMFPALLLKRSIIVLWKFRQAWSLGEVAHGDGAIDHRAAAQR